LVRVLSGKIPKRHLVDLAFAITTNVGLGESQWEVVDTNRAVVQVFKLRLLRDDGLGETGFASTTGSDEANISTEYDLPRLLEVVNVSLRAVSAALDDLDGDVCERKIVSAFLRPEKHADAERRGLFIGHATGNQLVAFGVTCCAKRHEYVQRLQRLRCEILPETKL
jgi:hypothetical protein